MNKYLRFALCTLLCMAFILAAIVAWCDHRDILAFILGLAGFIAGYFALPEKERTTNK